MEHHAPVVAGTCQDYVAAAYVAGAATAQGDMVAPLDEQRSHAPPPHGNGDVVAHGEQFGDFAKQFIVRKEHFFQGVFLGVKEVKGVIAPAVAKELKTNALPMAYV